MSDPPAVEVLEDRGRVPAPVADVPGSTTVVDLAAADVARQAEVRFMLMAHENVNIVSGDVYGPLNAPRAMVLVNNEIGIQIGNNIAAQYGHSSWDFQTQTGGGLWNDHAIALADVIVQDLVDAEVPVWLS